MSAGTWQSRVAWTVALMLVLPAFGWLGTWQWRSATVETSAQVPQGINALADVVPLETFVPRAAIGSRVRASGMLRADRGVVVCGRDLSGRSADPGMCWLVEPLELDSGAAVAVVTGVVTRDSARDLTPDPTRITVTGILQASEGLAVDITRAPTGLPQLAALTTPALLEVWPYQLHDGYIVIPPIQPLMERPPAASLDLRNLAYALQWWFFAGFAVFVWWRAMRPIDLATPETSPDTVAP